ncbi:MAG: alpha/beta fold hydrolase [Verrucomicrobiaceae bacterium]|nr:MAG: alpha/beta fold hydrolase [Verrucomicrobiaceae bacterium]
MLPTTAPTFQESMLPVAGGISLRLRTVDIPDGEVQAEAVLTHGFGEHSRRYEHVAAALSGCGIRAWTYDLRGHGRSGGRRGDAVSYELFLKDLGQMIERASITGRPCFLLGHSFGGQITLRYLQERQPEIRGAVICSPWLKLAFRTLCASVMAWL